MNTAAELGVGFLKSPLPRFLPPRPERAVHPDLLDKSFGNEWVAQAKMNGTYSLIQVEDGRVSAYRRDLQDHKLWAFTPESARPFKNLEGRWVFCAELLHSKTPHLKDINYVHDLLLADSRLLLGVRYLDRLRLVWKALGAGASLQDKSKLGYQAVDDRLWLAKVYPHPFKPLYERLIQVDEIEGLVLKNTTTPLNLGNVSQGMVKCRRTHKNYAC